MAGSRRMKGDRVEVVVDTGGAVQTFEIVASRNGRRIEVTTARGVVEVTEVTRGGTPVRTGRFMASRLIALVEHPAREGDATVDVVTRRRMGAKPPAGNAGPTGRPACSTPATRTRRASKLTDDGRRPGGRRGIAVRRRQAPRVTRGTTAAPARPRPARRGGSRRRRGRARRRRVGHRACHRLALGAARREPRPRAWAVEQRPLGIGAVGPDAEAALIVLGDQPDVPIRRRSARCSTSARRPDAPDRRAALRRRRRPKPGAARPGGLRARRRPRPATAASARSSRAHPDLVARGRRRRRAGQPGRRHAGRPGRPARGRLGGRASEANNAQVDRHREVPDGTDFYAPVTGLFRADPTRTDEPVLVELLRSVQPGETWLDIGAGAGRYALPLARDLARSGGSVDGGRPVARACSTPCARPPAEHAIANVRIVEGRWPDVARRGRPGRRRAHRPRQLRHRGDRAVRGRDGGRRRGGCASPCSWSASRRRSPTCAGRRCGARSACRCRPCPSSSSCSGRWAASRSITHARARAAPVRLARRARGLPASPAVGRRRVARPRIASWPRSTPLIDIDADGGVGLVGQRPLPDRHRRPGAPR